VFNTTAAALCVILNIRLMPPPVTVINAVRSLVVVFAAQVTFTLPLLEPEDAETVAHVALLETVHDVFDVMLTGLLSPPAANDSVEGETVNTTAAPL